MRARFAYACAACGFEGEAEVVGEGWVEGAVAGAAASAPEPAAADGSAAADALEHAEGAAWGDALTTVELAPCPRCEARDGRRWRAWLGAQLPGALALGALAGLVVALGSFVLRPEPDGWPLLLGLAAWPLAAAGVLGARVSRKRRRATTLRWR
ncbi:MAG TPA: hypothetical protein RMH85_35715 [Polyangiaceae bacterium LLY-WYZ-15_(1-7)]|nr:hypothetical protein [Polyangiaceae bacterium LLY-WYZ-15_(1-7)]HJL13889.1 hypothetical protein [Polyangiaceae bacterium LLY-WYZ-15_(1-7)]